jgi:aspartyl-tRNA(Asn)/glutamyl-tRNA(Gln) amidotransferase subunit B
VSPQQIADIAKLVEESSINRNTAKDIFNKSIKTGESPLKLIKTIKAEKISDEQELIENINEVLYAEPNLIEQSTNNPNIYNFILGKIMKKTSGRADPQLTIKLIKKEIEDKKIKK